MEEYTKNDNAKKVWGYEKAEDFVMGFTIGMIFAHFKDHFVVTHRRDLSPVEGKEVMSVILLNAPEIRKKLFGPEKETTTGTGIG